jgi:hypothetical protein
MAALQTSNRVLPHIRRIPKAPRVRPSPIVPFTSPSLAQNFCHLAQVLLGITFLVLGIALVLTLVLLPIGLPLALFGMALIAAPSDH